MAEPPVVPGLCRRVIACAIWLLAVAGWWGVFAQMPAGGPIAGPAPPAPGAEPQVLDVRIEGDRTIPLDKIRSKIRTRPGRPYDPLQIQKDVRELNRARWFVDIRPMIQQAPGGVIVIFRVSERPLLKEIKIVGNVDVSTSALKKEIDLKVGEAADPFNVEQARRKIEEFYHKKGYSKVRVTIFEGNKPGDLRAVFVVDEGPKQKILWISFVGNTIVSSYRLQTQIESRHPYFYLFKGEVDRKKIDEDVDRLTAYYRGLGFLDARIGRRLDFNEKQNWLTLTFVIDEGPRFTIRNVAFQGNMKIPAERLLAKVKLTSGKYFSQGQLLADVNTIQDQYGGMGYVFADVKPEHVWLEQPGQLDLVYHVTEGDRYYVKRINVEIKGENPHTRWTTVLNPGTLKPGDIVDTREIRAWERRLKASGIYVVDPSKGQVPKVVMNPPELEDKDKTEMARKPPASQSSYYRGPQPQSAAPPGAAGPLPPLGPGERYADIVVQYDNLDDLQHDAADCGQAPPPDGPVAPLATPMVIRGQVPGEGGYSIPELPPRAAPPAAPAYSNAPAPYAAAPPAAPAYSNAPAPYAAAPPAAPAYPNAPAPYAAAPPAAPAYSNGAAPYAAAPPAYAGAPGPYAAAPPAGAPGYPAVAPGWPNSAPAAGQPCPLPYGNPTMGAAPPYEVPQPDRLFGDPNGYLIPNAQGEPLRPLPLDLRAEEGQTGKLMFGVGVNSDAGLVGSIILDEQNFDWRRWPTSWEDIANGTAFRGDGERFRLELVPGTEVQRYMVTYQDPFCMFLEDKPVGLGLNGFYYQRFYPEWEEQRAGGRVSLGYQFTRDLTGTLAFRAQDVRISNPEFLTVPDLNVVLGHTQLYGFQAGLAHDTRDNQFLATEGHLLQASFEEVVGSFSYPHAEITFNQFFKLYERADLSGRHVLSLSTTVGISGDDTPIYERYYGGGFSTIRGFMFRGVSPRDPTTGMVVGGDFEWLNSIQYLFPITADDMLRGVVFVDGGTIQASSREWDHEFRVAPGFGLRITVPMMGPAPIALDFAFPINAQPGDEKQVFSFFVGFGR
jgi:outer membrane protein insertion porin family